MTMRPSILILCLLLLAGAGAAALWAWPRPGAIDPDDPVQVARGATLYADHCARCHGSRLEGEPDWRVRKPNGELPAPPHDATGHTWHHSDEQLFSMTKHGMAPFVPPGYRSAMPAFAGQLADDDIRAVIAYIKSTWPEEIRRRQESLGAR